MKLICTQENFKKAITNAERIISKQNTLPILNNILLKTENNYLKIVATNLEIGIEIKIRAKIEKEGKITIPARILGSFSTNLIDEENIEIEQNAQNLRIKNGLTKANIKGFSAEDFPLIPQKKSNRLFGISNLKLRDIFSKILISVARNDARQELSGVNIVFGETELFFASTDGFRLSEYVLTLSDCEYEKDFYSIFIEKTKSIIVPANTLIELNRIISNNSDSKSLVQIFVEDGQIFVEFEDIKIVSRLINGKYPEYRHIMPEKYKTTIIGEKKIIQNALKIAGVFVSNKINEVVLKIDENAKNVFVNTKSVEAGDNSTEIKFETQGVSQEIVFNLKYLLDGINVINSDKLKLMANSDTSPVAIREFFGKTEDEKKGFVYIIMPIKN